MTCRMWFGRLTPTDRKALTRRKIHPAWAAALAGTAPEETMLSRAFTGRAGLSIATNYVRAAIALDAPAPAPYPVQRGLTAAFRAATQQPGDVQRMQARGRAVGPPRPGRARRRGAAGDLGERAEPCRLAAAASVHSARGPAGAAVSQYLPHLPK
jgi:hypothetical protein